MCALSTIIRNKRKIDLTTHWEADLLIKGKIEKVDELQASSFDIVRVLLPLIDAEISFHYSVVTALPKTPVLLPSFMTDLAKITATELWRRMWDGLEQTKSEKTNVFDGFLSYQFSMCQETPTFSGISILAETSRERARTANQIFSYGFYRMLPVTASASMPSDKYFQKIIAPRPLIFKGKTYDVNGLSKVIESLKWRFDFINWGQTRFFKETLTIDEMLSLVKILSNLRKKDNCVCVWRKSLEKKLAKEMNKSRKEARKIIENLCNRKYTRLHPTFTDYLRKLRGKSYELDENHLKVLIKIDDLAGPYRGSKPLPFLEIKGFIFTSLWLLHYLFLEDIFEKTESLYLQRGFSLEKSTEKFLIDYGFKVTRNVKWIQLDPTFDKTKCEIDVVAYRNGILLLIQCKSYVKQKLENKKYGINRQSKSWRQISEYLSHNLDLLLKKLKKQNLELYKEINERGVEVIYPLLITEVDDFGVVHGCRVIGILKFLTEIYYILRGNMWNDLIKSKEAISIQKCFAREQAHARRIYHKGK